VSRERKWKKKKKKKKTKDKPETLTKKRRAMSFVPPLKSAQQAGRQAADPLAEP
jgi:hypothetical protein